MTQQTPAERAANLAAAYGIDRAQEIAQRSVERQAGTPSGDRWEAVAEMLAAQAYWANSDGDDLGAPLFI